MVRVLIPVHSRDIHAKAVRDALHSKGHEAVLFYGADYPTRQLASISFSQEAGLNWKVSGSGLEIANEKFEVVWYRRPMAPVLPDDMHPGDRAIANRECQAFTRGFWQLVAPSAFWETVLDWRHASTDVRVEATTLPRDVDHACRLLMKELGIVFGCFDFIVTPEGDYIFLEVNEMGQFLWIEEVNPDLLLRTESSVVRLPRSLPSMSSSRRQAARHPAAPAARTTAT
jgi:hypothetical protein